MAGHWIKDKIALIAGTAKDLGGAHHSRLYHPALGNGDLLLYPS